MTISFEKLFAALFSVPNFFIFSLSSPPLLPAAASLPTFPPGPPNSQSKKTQPYQEDT